MRSNLKAFIQTFVFAITGSIAISATLAFAESEEHPRCLSRVGLNCQAGSVDSCLIPQEKRTEDWKPRVCVAESENDRVRRMTEIRSLLIATMTDEGDPLYPGGLTSEENQEIEKRYKEICPAGYGVVTGVAPIWGDEVELIKCKQVNAWTELTAVMGYMVSLATSRISLNEKESKAINLKTDISNLAELQAGLSSDGQKKRIATGEIDNARGCSAKIDWQSSGDIFAEDSDVLHVSINNQTEARFFFNNGDYFGTDVNSAQVQVKVDSADRSNKITLKGGYHKQEGELVTLNQPVKLTFEHYDAAKRSPSDARLIFMLTAVSIGDQMCKVDNKDDVCLNFLRGCSKLPLE